MLEALNAPAFISHVTLAVRELYPVARFYEEALGLVRAGEGEGGVGLAAADGTVLLRLVSEPGLVPARADETGLFHTAFLLPGRASLAAWLRHAAARGLPLEGASDHLVSEAVYLSDPEGNGIEVYADRPRASWRREGEGVAMATAPLDGPGLLAEAPAGAEPWRFPAGGRIGHVHLKVDDLAAAEAFYRDELHMEVMARYPGAVFLSWGGYHHHLAVNVWRSRGAGPRRQAAAGLRGVAVIRKGLGARGAPPSGRHADPSGNRLDVA